MKDLEIMCEEVKKKIFKKLRKKLSKIYDKKQKRPHIYKIGDLMAIQRTQFCSELKLRLKFYEPYEMKHHCRCDVKKVGNHKCPINANTAADHLKPWC